MKRERRLNLLIVTLTVVAIFAVPYAVVKTHVVGAMLDHDPVDCGDYEFDQQEWADVEDQGGRGKQAEGLARCEPIVGLSRGEVRDLLGDPSLRSNRMRWSYDGGDVGRDFGYHSSATVFVNFGRDGRVTKIGIDPQPADEMPPD